MVDLAAARHHSRHGSRPQSEPSTPDTPPAGDAGAAEKVPLPIPRPLLPGMTVNVPLPIPRPSWLGTAPVPPQPEGPSACEIRIASDHLAIIERLPPLVGPGQCGAPDVVRLDAVLMPDQRRVAFAPPPTLRCSMAEAIADWVRADVAPLADTLGAPLASIENYDSYDCRGMNRVVGAKLSEHGRANALDIRSVKLANRKVFQLTETTVSRAFRERMRASACARFMTVLGPGSDGYHEEHIHVDLAERHSGYRICQWDVREPVAEIPLPRPRPAAADANQKL